MNKILRFSERQLLKYAFRYIRPNYKPSFLEKLLFNIHRQIVFFGDRKPTIDKIGLGYIDWSLKYKGKGFDIC